MDNFEDKNTPYRTLSRKGKFVNTLWCTPIYAVIILLLLLVTWIPTTIKLIAITILIFAHSIQYGYTFYRWRVEVNHNRSIHTN